MSSYYDDYENVATLGLNGIDSLRMWDKVYIFYSENAKTRLTIAKWPGV